MSGAMQQQTARQSGSLYQVASILFFMIGSILVVAAIRTHDWVYWAFAGITLLNGCMTTLKYLATRETGK